MKKLLLLLLFLPWAGSAAADDGAIAKLFADQGIKGAMVLSSLNGKTFVHNSRRAKRRFAVASTFKIPNTLIALEEKVIRGKDDVLKWDGQVREFPDWNRDQTLASAFKVSCLWFYQALARRVGAQKYRNYLRGLSYGKLREPFEETTFWLNGSLQISAAEQVEFLKKVHRRSLPFSASSYETLRDIMVAEQTPAFTIRAKTGWAMAAKPQVGWYVGYAEAGDDVWFFATNLGVRDPKDLPLRQKLTREALQAKGIIE